MALAQTASDAAILDLPDEAATRRLGRALASVLRAGDVIALSGELGAGKTSLARTVIQALPSADGSDEEAVPSPTFTLVQIYDRAPAPLWHFDLFRLEAADEALELGIEEALAEGISLIEWPERLGAFLPAERLDLRLDFAASASARRATLTPYGAWCERLPAVLARCHG